jgi:hypothetical protein
MGDITGFSPQPRPGPGSPPHPEETPDREGEKPRAVRSPGARNDCRRNRDRSDARGARGRTGERSRTPSCPRGRRLVHNSGSPHFPNVAAPRLESAMDGSIACGRSMIG